MLDQNTDRMWFVIGAVIVGAAIIFIANGTLPEVFASVSDTFKSQSDKATEVIESMDVNIGSKNNLTVVENDFFGWVVGSLNGMPGQGQDYATSRVLRSEYIHLEEGTYEYVSSVKDGSGLGGTRMWISFYDPNSISDRHHTYKNWNGSGRIEFTVPEGGWRARFLIQTYRGPWLGRGDGEYQPTDILHNNELLHAVANDIEVKVNKISE